MQSGVEIGFVVKDSLEALKDYQKIFNVEVISQTNLQRGLNEVIFKIEGTQFHMLDENPEFSLNAPKPEHPQSIWFNVIVPDIHKTWQKALETGAKEIRPITKMEEMGASNAIFLDKHGYVWMLHEIHQKVDK